MLAEFLPTRPYPLETAWVEAIFQNAVGAMASYFGLRVPRLDEVFEEEDGVIARVRPDFKIKPTVKVLLAPLRAVILSLKYKASEWTSDPLLAEFNSRLERLRSTDIQGASWNDLTRLAREALDLLRLMGEIRRRYLPSAVLSAS